MKRKKLKILIVEDEFISRTLLKEMLTRFGECHEVENGREAVEKLEKSYIKPEEKFDLVCLDIMMPEMNGHEVLRRLRQIEKQKGIDRVDTTKVVMVTALDDPENIMEAMVNGRCDAYLTKPVSKAQLEDQLRDLCLISSAVTN